MIDRPIRHESLTIYLAKSGLEVPARTIKDASELRHFEVSDDEGPLGTLYVQTNDPHPPKWASFFAPKIRPSDLGRVSSTAAVLYSIVDGRAFLVTFGQGRHLLESDCYEERFGLKVTLNSIGENQIRSVDKHTLDTIGTLTRVQASKEGGPGEFGIDVERDLLKAVTGVPSDKSLGKTLTGFDALHVMAVVDLNSLRQLLSCYLAQSEKPDYKDVFPWVDHIAEVKELTRRDELDMLMLKAVAAARSDICWLAVPEPIEWGTVASFRHRPTNKAPSRHDLRLEAFLQDNEILPDQITVDLLKKTKIVAMDGNDNVKYQWSSYRCLYCEIEDRDQTFILSDGKWYHIDNDFVARINREYREIPLLSIGLPPYNDGTETEYNKRVAAEEPATYALMDRKLVSTGGGRGKIEFCDLYSAEKDLIHVKRYGGSGVLSHLFTQGVVSGQLFVSDMNFRQKVNGILPLPYKVGNIQTRPNTNLFRVVFAVVSNERGGGLTLPFFSRLSLRQAMQSLDSFGYRTALAKIPVEPCCARLTTHRKLKKRDKRK